MPTCIVDIPDVVLELVLLRVRTPACLFRAAATCKLWHRVIAGDGFLQRFRSRHSHGSHLFLGHYIVTTDPWGRAIDAEFVPSPPRPAIGLRQRLSLDFLIQPREEPHIRRELTDSRGGLLAFVRDNWYAVVCDPWTRQYRELPAFPWGQDLSYDDDVPVFCRGESSDESSDDDDVPVLYHCCGAFLVDNGAFECDDNSRSPLSSFWLLCVCLLKDDYFNYWVESCVFSARDNRWVSSSTFGSGEISYTFVGRAKGYIFWAGESSILSLDESTGEFSMFELPLSPGAYRWYSNQKLRVVAGEGAGGIRIVRVVDGGSLEVLTASSACGAGECMVESRASLCWLTNIEVKPDQSWCFVDTASTEGMLVLEVCSPSSGATTMLFSLDVETMKMKRQPEPEPETSETTQRVFQYERPWPQTI